VDLGSTASSGISAIAYSKVAEDKRTQVETLRALRDLGHPAHLILSAAAGLTLAAETDLDADDVRALAPVVHDNANLGASVASGSFPTVGMIVAPCSMKTLSGIANSYADTLIARAADVTLKEGRPLVLLVRETPLHKGHLDLMIRAADMGAIILPPLPAFYHRPRTIQDLVRHGVGKALDRLGIKHDLYERWSGISG